jgi:hypothetical protein
MEFGYRFSEHFAIQSRREDDWFDPLLPVDTELCVDPFRIYVDEKPAWEGAHDRLIEFFNMVLELVAKSKGDRSSAHWKAAERLLLFPEPPEFCLGYGATPLGAGSAELLRETMLGAASTTIRLGIESIEHFEELTLFQEQVGADRIGDIACNVLKAEFIDYTHGVIERHGLWDHTAEIAVRHARWSRDHYAWLDEPVRLPINPFTRRPIGVILTPARFLRKLPTVDPLDFWEYAYANENEQIRGQFNFDVGRNVDSREIVRLAQSNPEVVRRYVKRLEKNPLPPYDLANDPRGEVNWYDAAARFAGDVPPPPDQPDSPDDFCQFVRTLLGEFVWLMEDRGHYDLLWVGTKPRSEKHVQSAFDLAMVGYCKTNDIDLTPESNAGRGPVDFKFSRGWSRRALVEIKLANNTKYWDGLLKQTPQYMRSEGIQCGYFLTIQFRDADLTRERISRVEAAAAKVSADRGYEVTPIFVDARPKPSASKL